MTRRKVQYVWVRFAESVKHANTRALLPEYSEPCQQYRQATRYSNTY